MDINWVNRVAFDYMAVYGDDGWACNIFYAALFHIDLKTLEIDFVTMLPCEKLFGFSQYAPIQYWEGKLIIGPRNAEDILIYNLNEKDFTIIKLKDSLDTTPEYLFNSAVSYHDKVYFFPGRSSAIIELNLRTYNIRRIFFTEEQMELLRPDSENVIFLHLFALKGNKVLIPSAQNNTILCFELEQNSQRIISIPQVSKLYSLSCESGGFLLAERGRMRMYSWDGEDEVKKKSISKSGFVSTMGLKKVIVCNNKFRVYIPENANMILKEELETNEISCLKTLKMEYTDELKCTSILMNQNMRYFDMVDDENLLYYSVYDGRLVKLNLVTGECLEKDSTVKEDDLGKVLRHFIPEKSGEILEEEERFTLNDFINALQ